MDLSRDVILYLELAQQQLDIILKTHERMEYPVPADLLQNIVNIILDITITLRRIGADMNKLTGFLEDVEEDDHNTGK